jgi:hypothetical protein
VIGLPDLRARACAGRPAAGAILRALAPGLPLPELRASLYALRDHGPGRPSSSSPRSPGCWWRAGRPPTPADVRRMVEEAQRWGATLDGAYLDRLAAAMGVRR